MKHKWMPVMYANYYGILRYVAYEYGYALAILGSLKKDMDLILVPWVDNPKSHIDLLLHFRKALGCEREDGKPYDTIEQKPQGRVSYTINTGGGGYLDISIMPTLKETP